MLLDDDVVADGETEAGPFASGFRREEWIEYLFLHLKRHIEEPPVKSRNRSRTDRRPAGSTHWSA